MKKFALIFSPLAIEDAEQAFEYYEERQKGLGVKFTT